MTDDLRILAFLTSVVLICLALWAPIWVPLLIWSL